MASNSFLSPMLQSLQQKTRQPRQGCQYNQEEMVVLRKYKEVYRNTITHEERDSLLQQSILVDIFNHWDSKNIRPTGPEAQQRAKA